jgi:D-alanyl-D-alanine carboxypeptidase
MAVAVAEAVDGSADKFAAEMNATAAKLGLMRTHYNNVNGLPDDGQVTTARDLAVLTIDLRRTFPQYADIFRTREVKLDNVYLRSDNALLNTFAGTDGMKTGFICSAGLNIVATAHRNGRELMAIVLGGSSGRERDEMAAQMLLRGFAGEYPDKGESVVNLVDDLKSPPTDMTSYICGKKAKEYVRAQRKAYPMGLPGKPSYLTDKIASIVYNATDLGPAGGPAVASAADSPDAQGDGDGPPDAVAKTASAPIPMPRRASHHHHRR